MKYGDREEDRMVMALLLILLQAGDCFKAGDKLEDIKRKTFEMGPPPKAMICEN